MTAKCPCVPNKRLLSLTHFVKQSFRFVYSSSDLWNLFIAMNNMRIIPSTPSPFIGLSQNFQPFQLSMSTRDARAILLTTNSSTYARHREKEASTSTIQTIQLEQLKQCHVENDQSSTANILSMSTQGRTG